MFKRILIIFSVFASVCFKVCAAPPDISASCACLADAVTGKIIYEYNASKRAPMASTTKIMTAIVAIENGDLNDAVAVSDYAARQEGSSAYFSPGDKILLGEALYGLMLNSGNDAAAAIAEHIGGSVEGFTQLMNKKADELGLYDTNFENPSGLDGQSHYTTAIDLARLTSYALKNDVFRRIVGEKVHKTEYSSGCVYFTNHNKLLSGYDGCIGIKTGFTKKSGRCLVSAAQRGPTTLVCVMLRDGNDWVDHKALLDYGFESAKIKSVVSKGDVLKKIKSSDGKYVSAVSAEDFSYSVWGCDKTQIILHTLPEIGDSINKGEKIGYFDVVSNEKIIKSIDIVSGDEYKAEKSIREKLFHLLKNLRLSL